MVLEKVVRLAVPLYGMPKPIPSVWRQFSAPRSKGE
jgi:hypothetical protein